MSKFAFLVVPAGLILGSACTQVSQQAVGPIPPPAPETLCRPIPLEQVNYYTLPEPITND